MFDIDGTLVKSVDWDTDLFENSITSVIGRKINTRWHEYDNVTDSGIVSEILDKSEKSAALKIKLGFIEAVKMRLESLPAEAVPGADKALAYLSKIPNVRLSIATGGWKETAIMKLKSSNIFDERIPLATASDHHSRTEIMKVAEARHQESFLTKTYIGDAVWDAKASEILGYNFIHLSDNSTYPKSIQDYLDLEKLSHLIGLS